MPQHDPQLARLLSGKNAPSVLEKEAILARVFADVERPTQRASRALWAGGMLAAAAAVCLAVWSGSPRVQDELTAKGGASEASLALHCPATGCVPGAVLGIELEPPPALPYFALFMREPGGGIVWYFPERDGVSRSVADVKEGRLLPEGATLPQRASPGRYELFGVFTRVPLSREALKLRLGEDFASSADMLVVRRSISVEPAP